jgi:hypothetical protein
MLKLFKQYYNFRKHNYHPLTIFAFPFSVIGLLLIKAWFPYMKILTTLLRLSFLATLFISIILILDFLYICLICEKYKCSPNTAYSHDVAEKLVAITNLCLTIGLIAIIIYISLFGINTNSNDFTFNLLIKLNILAAYIFYGTFILTERHQANKILKQH